jgi:hypothetical protein
MRPTVFAVWAKSSNGRTRRARGVRSQAGSQGIACIQSTAARPRGGLIRRFYCVSSRGKTLANCRRSRCNSALKTMRSG